MFLGVRSKVLFALAGVASATAAGISSAPISWSSLWKSTIGRSTHRISETEYSTSQSRLSLNNTSAHGIGAIPNEQVTPKTEVALVSSQAETSLPPSEITQNFQFDQLFEGVEDSKELRKLKEKIAEETRKFNDSLKSFEDNLRTGESAIKRWRISRKTNNGEFLDKLERIGIERYFLRLIEFENKIEEFMKTNSSLKDKIKWKKVNKFENKSLEDIKNALKNINWSDKGRIIIVKGNLENNLGWGSWEENPYKSFYNSEEEWKSQVRKIQERTSAFEYDLWKNLNCATAGYVDPREELIEKCFSKISDHHEKELNQLKHEIEFTVGAKLLEWSGRLQAAS